MKIGAEAQLSAEAKLQRHEAVRGMRKPSIKHKARVGWSEWLYGQPSTSARQLNEWKGHLELAWVIKTQDAGEWQVIGSGQVKSKKG